MSTINAPATAEDFESESRRLGKMSASAVALEFDTVDLLSVSTAALCALLIWDDRNGDYEECTRSDLIEIYFETRVDAADPPMEFLRKALSAWQLSSGLPQQTAEECRDRAGLTQQQKDFLDRIIAQCEVVS